MSALTVHLHAAQNVPKKDIASKSDPFVDIEVIIGGDVVAKTASEVIWNDDNPTWDSDHTLADDEAQWDLTAAKIKFTISDMNTMKNPDFIGEAEIAVVDLAASNGPFELLMRTPSGNPVLDSKAPYWPCLLLVSLNRDSLPPELAGEPADVEAGEEAEEAPSRRHVMLITRGTRGDVQPFVALARGMALQQGWLVTVCTELRWKDFVLSVGDVSPGTVQFLDSGGDTETRVNSSMGQWATSQKTEFIQMMMLACSESEFFNSAPVIMKHLTALQEGSQPVEMLIYGFTLTSIGVMAGEKFNIPAAGFFLQPSGIPSADPNWPAVQAISSHGSGLFSIIDSVEAQMFTGQESLALFKKFAEKNPLAKLNINNIRSCFDLPGADTWVRMRQLESPVVIPMRRDTFTRPNDWWDDIITTDFIFLRQGDAGPSSLAEPLENFINGARDAEAKLGLMTFSSMPVARRTMLRCAAKMVQECAFNLRLIYVGKRHEGNVPEDLAAEVDALEEQGRFLDVEKADFGVLFQHMDLFIVHGGLGTTVEALRMKKPTMVAGPLLLDQRFWGGVCADKGLGAPAVHIDNFESECVAFVDAALDPADPLGYQANAQQQDWGDASDDGVQTNVDCFVTLLERLTPTSPE